MTDLPIPRTVAEVPYFSATVKSLPSSKATAPFTGAGRVQLRPGKALGSNLVEGWSALQVLPERGGQGAAGTGIILDVAIETRLPASSPVARVVVVGPRPCGEKAEENVAGRLHDDSRMSGPHDHIAGLRLRDPAKSFNPVVEIVRTRIDIRKSGAPVNGMHQVRTIVGGIAPRFRVECDGDDRSSIIAS